MPFLDLSARDLLLYPLRVVLFGTVAGLVVYLIVFGFRIYPQGFLWTTLAGTSYAFVMLTANELVIRLADRHLSLDSRRDVLLRICAIAVTTLLSFLLTTAVLELVVGFQIVQSSGMLIVVALVAFSGTMIGTGIHHLDLFYRRVRSAEQAAVRAELQALRAQINPHFLFNSLNSIASLIRTAPAQAEETIESLADLFRYSLRASSHPTVTLAEELESIELYLAIERARFRDRLDVAIDIPGEIHRARVPSLLLQPLVENAVKHGVSNVEGTCRIEVRGWSDGETIRISVRDTGPGFDLTDPEIVLARGAGLTNVRDRLRWQFGAPAGLKILRDGVEIHFPFERDHINHGGLVHDPVHHRR